MRPVLVFAKAPQRGRVKRRLAAGIGDAAALDFYRETLFGLVQRLRQAPQVDPILVVTPDEAVDDPALWPDGVPRQPQGTGELGERMRRALEAAPALPVVLIGSDIPGIRVRHIERAFAALAGHDLVFGPAEDGGFWLVGTRRRPLPRSFFESVRWSTRHALEDSLASVPQAWSVAMVDVLADIDDEAAYRRCRSVEEAP